MLNKVILMGRLVADPEYSKTQSGVSRCRFRIAIDRPYQKDKERQTDFISCSAWRNVADFLQKYFSKGKMIIVEGTLQNNDYTDKNGIKHYSMTVNADNVKFGESKTTTESSNSFKVPEQQLAAQSDNDLSFGELGDMDDFEEILSDGGVPF